MSLSALGRAVRAVIAIGVREFRTTVRSRAVLVGTVALGGLVAAVLIVHAAAFGPAGSMRVGLAGQAIALRDVLPADTADLGVGVTISQLSSVDAGIAQLRSGQLDVVVSGSRAALHVTVEDNLDPRLRTTLNSIVRQQVLEAEIAQLGLKPADVLSRVEQAQITVTPLREADPQRGQRIAVGVVAEVLVALALALAGFLAMARVAEDKTAGTVAAQLMAVPPRRQLLGNVGGLGTIGLGQVAAVGLLGGTITVLAGVVGVADSVFTALGASALWFVAGFALYGTVSVVAAALVAQWRDLRGLMFVLGAVLAAVLAASAAVSTDDPAGPGSAILSLLPPFAPILMPGRMAVGAAPGWQILLALALTLGTAAALIWFGGRVYGNAMPRTAGRVSLREALNRPVSA
jgi:ABC-2 type transport system permease protein